MKSCVGVNPCDLVSYPVYLLLGFLFNMISSTLVIIWIQKLDLAFGTRYRGPGIYSQVGELTLLWIVAMSLSNQEY